MPEVAGAAEEAREEVEGVVGAGAAAALLVLLDAFVAVLVVDLAGFGRGEGVVGFGDGDEFVVRGVVAAGRYQCCSAVDRGKERAEEGLLGEDRKKGGYGFLSGWYCLLSLR